MQPITVRFLTSPVRLGAVLLLWVLSVSAQADTTASQPLDMQRLQQYSENAPRQALSLSAEYLARPLNAATRLEVLTHRCLALMVLSDYGSVQQLFQQSEPLLHQPGLEAHSIDIESCYARSLENQGERNQALAIYNKLLALAKAHDLKLQLANVYSSRGQLYGYRGAYAQSIEDLTRAFDLLELSDHKDQQLELRVINAMGNTYGYMHQHQRALEYYRQVNQILQQMGDLFGQSVATYNIANSLISLEQYAEALVAARQSRALSVEADDEIGIAYADMQIASCLAHFDRFEEAIATVRQAHQIFVKFDEAEGVAKTLLKQATWLDQLGFPDQALEFALQAKALYDDTETVSEQAKTHKLLADIYARQGNFEAAFEHLQQQLRLNQQLFDKDMNRHIVQMENKFHVQVQQKENELLKAQNQVKQAKLEQADVRRWLLLLAALALVVVACVLSYLLWILRRTNRRLADTARTDPLTGIANRRFMLEQLQRERVRAQRHHTSFTLVLMDVDHFKLINDSFGHHVGDSVLRSLAGVLKSSIRVVDAVSRHGGEEFLILLPNTCEQQAAPLVERLRQAVAALEVNGLPSSHPVTASFGYAEFDGEESLERLLQRADRAMYAAKQEGRNLSLAACEVV